MYVMMKVMLYSTMTIHRNELRLRQKILQDSELQLMMPSSSMINRIFQDRIYYPSPLEMCWYT